MWINGYNGFSLHNVSVYHCGIGQHNKIVYGNLSFYYLILLYVYNKVSGDCVKFCNLMPS